jgi:hypothetical protein
LWLELFPHARVVHIRRHGIDVARSLKVRRQKKFEAGRHSYDRMRSHFGPFYWLRQKQSGFGGSLRCATLEGGFSLWEAYMGRADLHVESLGERALEVCYEQFLRAPAVELKRLCLFCSLDASDRDIENVIHSVRSDRAYAFSRDEEAADFALSVGDRLAAFGYSAEPRSLG